MKGRFNKVVAIVVALSMIMCTGTLSAFAEKQPTMKIVTFGDSMSNGYGTDEFWNGLKDSTDPYSMGGIKCGGFDHVSSFAYPNAIVKYLEGKGYDASVSKFNFEGMRFDELHAILGEDGVAYEAEKRATDAHSAAGHITDWADGDANWNENGVPKSFSDLEALRADAQGDVTDADLVILDNFNTTFGTYLAQRLLAILGCLDKTTGKFNHEAYAATKYNHYVEDLDISPALKSVAEVVKTDAMEYLKSTGALSGGAFSEDLAKELAEMLAYCYADSCWALSQSLEDIYTLNPDAKVVVIGPQNDFTGIHFAYGTADVDLGKYAAKLFEAVNKYVQYQDYYSPAIQFVDASNATLETFADMWRSYDPATICNDENASQYVSLLTTFSAGMSRSPKISNSDIQAAKDIATSVGTTLTDKQAAQFLLAGMNNLIPDPTTGGTSNVDFATFKTNVVNTLAYLSGQGMTTQEQQLKGGTIQVITGVLANAGPMADNIVKNLVKGANNTTFDLVQLINMNLYGEVNNLTTQITTNTYENMEAKYQTLLSMFEIFLMQCGTGVHPSDQGCKDKEVLVEAAVDKVLGLNANPRDNFNDYDQMVEKLLGISLKLAQMYENGEVPSAEEVLQMYNEYKALKTKLDAAGGVDGLTGNMKALQTAVQNLGAGIELIKGVDTQQATAIQDAVTAIAGLTQADAAIQELVEGLTDSNTELAKSIADATEALQKSIDDNKDIINTQLSSILEQIQSLGATSDEFIELAKSLGLELDDVKDAIEQIKEFTANLPSKEEIEKTIKDVQDKYDLTEDTLKNEVLPFVKELAEQLDAVRAELKITSTKEAVDFLREQVNTIGKKADDILDIIDEIPEIKDEIEWLRDDIDDVYDTLDSFDFRIAQLEQDNALIKAAMFSFTVKSSVSTTSNSVKATIKWSTDSIKKQLVDGYLLSVNGEEVLLENDGLDGVFVDKYVKAGKTYTYTIKPFVKVANSDEVVYGKAKTVVIVGKTKLVKASKVKSTMTLTWKKVVGATGYVVKYGTSKKALKTVTINGKTTAKIKKLNKKKGYYVSVKAYKKVLGKKYYGKETAYKLVKNK